MMTRLEMLVSSAAVAASASIPRLPSRASVNVAVVVGDRATVIDFCGPWEVFQDAAIGGNTSFSPYLVSDSTKPLQTTAGMTIVPKYDYSTAPQPHVILMGAQGEHTPEKIAWIRSVAPHADIVASVCTGAFLLAKTGLLDGMTATTHHDFYERFEKQFPKVHLVRGPRYVEHERIITGGGLSSGIEAALRIVERYTSPEAADKVAYYMEYTRSSQRPIA